ncbi:ABC transporter substrate-binding protein [Thalassospiraceae bacterium LMO-JJ14]|nr:ABC transporter substrate-binding protein [Thalassospiraceae bacterium LMO-JJ14]
MEFLKQLSKKQLFGLILALLVIMTIIGSIIANFTYLSDDEDKTVRIAVVAPLSGPLAVNGQSLTQGAELYAEGINEAGGIRGGRVIIDVYDDKNDPNEARRIAEDLGANSSTLAVIGHWSVDTTRAAAPVYQKHNLPMIAPTPLDRDIVEGNPAIFSSVYDTNHEAAFVANYTRNVLGQKTASIIHDLSPRGLHMADTFEETYKRFGTRIRYKWGFDSNSADLDQRIEEIAADLKPKLDVGTVFIAAEEDVAAKVLRSLREAKARNPVVGTSILATRAFQNALGNDGETIARYTNGIVASTPLLFDTANEEAQDFNSRYQNKFGATSDWVAAYAFDTTHLIVEGFKAGARAEEEEIVAGGRRMIRERLAAAIDPETGIRGITGVKTFTPDGEAKSPVFMGRYDGRDMVSALTQLQPIKAGVAANFIEELKKGKVLYVNDRFMYKTNVVYTGLQVKEVTDLDIEKGQVTLNFLLWFRYSGDFKPEDLIFSNAVEPIVLDTPAAEQISRGLNYKLFEVTGKFNYNFSKVKRPYGTVLIGFDFAHRFLNRNNLQYVTDVLGIGLAGNTTFQTILERNQVISEKLDWDIDRAWVSQEIVPVGTRGDPTYVGHGSVDPLFSRITMGILTSPARINVRDFVPEEYFVYLTIFGVLGTVFAVLMDRKKHGRFWSAQSWMLRLMSWPVLLLAGGSLLLDFAVQELQAGYVDMIVLVYDCLWWIVPARICGIALERFLWVPLEQHTRRMVPNVIRMFGSLNIYILAAFGIIAFVFDQKITSLLATSGLLAMIIGLAIQANISNVFSGIAINIERPFVVGDWVKIGDLEEGEVVDITWRTVRVKSRNGFTISVPNGQASEWPVHNYTAGKVTRLSYNLNVDPDVDPRIIEDVLMRALLKSENLVKEPKPSVRYNGTVDGYNDWGGQFSIQYWIANYSMREQIASDVWDNVWDELEKAGLCGKVSQVADNSGEAAAGTPEPQSQPAQ